jgi:hypothetical protein
VTRPLLILDCDEVILAFAQPFAAWLRDARGIALTFGSFALAGNMRRLDGGVVDADELPGLLDGFFAEGQHLQTPAEGVVDALGRLSDAMDMVVLTNVPDAACARRVEVLRGFGLDLEVVANARGKGRAVARLAHGRPAAVFVDDLPPHHASAAEHAPAVGRLHMVADPALRGLIPAAPHAHARIDRWAEAERWIADWMEDGSR